MGPRTIGDARFDYSEAISRSSEEMTLLNLVRIRFTELPIFLDVDQIVAGYGQEHFGDLNMDFKEIFNAGPNLARARYTARYTERPTITYSLMSGNRFVKAFMSTVPPDVLLGMTDSGWPIDRLLWVTVHSINGKRNVRVGASQVVQPDEEFVEFASVMRELQLLDAYTVVSRQAEGDVKTELQILDDRLPVEMRSRLHVALSAVGLDQECRSFRVVQGRVSPSPTTIAIHSRSIMGIMDLLAAHVEVPQALVDAGIVERVDLSKESYLTGLQQRISGGFRVRSSIGPPLKAAVSVRHHGLFFWIDSTDLNSKTVFAYLSLLLLLTQTGEADRPQLTISAN
jgi:hypothetical protein